MIYAIILTAAISRETAAAILGPLFLLCAFCFFYLAHKKDKPKSSLKKPEGKTFDIIEASEQLKNHY